MARRRSRFDARSRNRNLIIFSLLVLVAAVVVGLILRDRNSENGKVEPNQPRVDQPNVADNNVKSVEPEKSDKSVEPEPVVEERPTLPPAEVDIEPNAPPNMEGTQLIGEALSFMAANPPQFVGARDKLNEALKLPMNARQRMFVKEQMKDMAEKWLFSRDVYPGDKLCSQHTVQPGEYLSTICSKYKIPYEIIMALNHISSPKSLQTGQTLKMIHGPFNVRIKRSTFTMDLYLQDMYVRSFRIGIGKPGRETPTGLWCVKDRLITPPWTDPDTGRRYEAEDEDYPLGSRWIGLTGLEGAAKDRTGFAIHGTKNPEEIGAAVSRGCIRMYNGEVVLVYDLLVPTDSLVRVED